jgi:hypothetical protein
MAKGGRHGHRHEAAVPGRTRGHGGLHAGDRAPLQPRRHRTTVFPSTYFRSLGNSEAPIRMHSGDVGVSVATVSND